MIISFLGDKLECYFLGFKLVEEHLEDRNPFEDHGAKGILGSVLAKDLKQHPSHKANQQV